MYFVFTMVYLFLGSIFGMVAEKLIVGGMENKEKIAFLAVWPIVVVAVLFLLCVGLLFFLGRFTNETIENILDGVSDRIF